MKTIARRMFKERVEALTDDLAAPFESLVPRKLEELIATLEPIAALVEAGFLPLFFVELTVLSTVVVSQHIPLTCRGTSLTP
jgi:hypothetical protein